MTKKQFSIVIAAVYTISAIVSFFIIGGDEKVSLDEGNLGMICIAGVYPSISRGMIRDNIKGNIDNLGNIDDDIDGNMEVDIEDNIEGNIENDFGNSSNNGIEDVGNTGMIENVHEKNNENEADKADAPLIIIYHTHATESYQPISNGNFHTVQEEGSVREVGAVLAKELEKLGYIVIHDKTLNDAESYNQSYSRSKEQLKNLLKVNKEPAMIIDLHRDAASYTGNIGKTVLIDGKTSATFALVVGQGNENAGTLNILANDISNKAEELYPGFGGRIISKPYKYNQSVANCCVLLEVGNNENNIREANICAEYLAVVLDEVIKERKINI